MSFPSSPAAPASPRPVRWTCAEFHRFGDLGAFEGRRAMLIDGVILEEGPMNPPHAITLGLVEEAIRTAFGAGWWLRHPSPLILGLDLDPEPDLAVVPGRPRDYAAHPTTAELVVEVVGLLSQFRHERKAAALCPGRHPRILGRGHQWAATARLPRPPGRRLRHATDVRPDGSRFAASGAIGGGAGGGNSRVDLADRYPVRQELVA